jgi:hypothetical protein
MLTRMTAQNEMLLLATGRQLHDVLIEQLKINTNTHVCFAVMQPDYSYVIRRGAVANNPIFRGNMQHIVLTSGEAICADYNIAEDILFLAYPII